MNDDIYQAFASAAQENYNSRSSSAGAQQTQSLGFFNFSSGSNGGLGQQKNGSNIIDMEEVPQIKIKKSAKKDDESLTEEIKQSTTQPSTQSSPSRRFLEDEEEVKKPLNTSTSFMPQISLERRQAVSNFTERLFNQTTQQAILDNASNARDTVRERLRAPMNFVSNKIQVGRDTQRRGMIGGFIMAALFLLFAIQSLPLIILTPGSFNEYFSLGMLSLLFALFMRRQLNQQPETTQDGLSRFIPASMMDTRDTLATTFLLGSITGSLYFSVIDSSYLLSLIFCFLQLNSVLFYFFGVVYTPGAQSGSELFSNARNSLGGLRDRVQSTIAGQAIQTGYTRMVNGLNERIGSGNNNGRRTQSNDEERNQGGTILRDQPSRAKDNNSSEQQ